MGKMQTASFLLKVVVGSLMLQTTTALIHVVGGELGWDTPPNPNFYSDWANKRTFGVGDTLVFPYRPAAQDLQQVSKEDFETCGHNQVINQWMIGPTLVHLDKPGDYYYYCSVGTHCEMGQKLHITVGTSPGSDGVDWAAKAKSNARKLLSFKSSGPHLEYRLEQSSSKKINNDANALN